MIFLEHTKTTHIVNLNDSRICQSVSQNSPNGGHQSDHILSRIEDFKCCSTGPRAP